MDRELEESTSQYVSNSTTRDTHSGGVMNMTKVENCACLTNGGMSRGNDHGNNGLVRIYDHGETLLFDGMEKVKAFECMSHLGQGPRLLGLFPNGHLEEFLNARTLLGPDLHAPSISQNIGVKFHIEGLSHQQLWERLRDCLEKSKWNFVVISLVDDIRECFRIEDVEEDYIRGENPDMYSSFFNHFCGLEEEDDGLLYAPFWVAEKGRIGASSRDEGICGRDCPREEKEIGTHKHAKKKREEISSEARMNDDLSRLEELWCLVMGDPRRERVSELKDFHGWNALHITVAQLIETTIPEIGDEAKGVEQSMLAVRQRMLEVFQLGPDLCEHITSDIQLHRAQGHGCYMKALLRGGGNENATIFHGTTTLFCAASRCHVAFVEGLLDFFANKETGLDEHAIKNFDER
ncbi:hypothetical protein SUGI_0184310 [Cryptomeria japonica]|nr:hypothetical protein SUGI_0184310 [Cryptomeria japonica]